MTAPPTFIDRVAGKGGTPATPRQRLRAAPPWTDLDPAGRDDDADDPTACPICRRDSCDNPEHLPPTDPAAPPKPARPRLTVLPALQLMHEPRPVEIIEGFAWQGCLTVLVSERGTGKTFLLTDAAAAVSDGVLWHGRVVQQGSVLYLSYEGDALGLRLRALHEVTGRRLEHLDFVRASDPISPRLTREGEEQSIGELAVLEAVDALITTIETAGRPPIRLSVIDTVRASLSGSEDSSEHVAAYLRVVRRLMRRLPRAGFVLAHHAGWQDGETQRKRERGSSAWRGNADAVFYLEAGDYNAERGEAPLTLRALKVRDAERPAPLYAIRRRVELAEAVSTDLRRGPATSCVIARDLRTREDRQAEAKQAGEAADHKTDLAVLRVMQQHPNATSIKALRNLMGLKYDAVSASAARILRAKYATKAGERKPYVLTALGTAELEATEFE